MRIVSGSHKGRVITPPKDLKARPTTDFAKENLFNILANRFDLEELAVLDLFSGTGSISFEFASRGAAMVTSVELNPRHHSFIKKCVTELGLEKIVAIRSDVFKFLEKNPNSWDIIFSDAPYDLKDSGRVIDLVLEGKLLNAGGVLIFEHSKSENYTNHPNFTEQRNYGSVQFSFFQQL